MIPYSRQKIEQDDIDAVVEVLKSDYLTGGEVGREFERAISSYVGVKHAITFNSATSALHASYSVAGLKEGDEVITTPISFVATSNMLVELGVKPVFCDVKLDGNINERFIEKHISSKTKAIVPVDFGGNSVEIKKINEIAKAHNLLVIEDACHALGSEFDGAKVGSLSDMAIFSFHAIKPISLGEGGCVVTNDDEYAKKLRLFRSHGMVKKRFWNSDMISMGYNYRLTDIQAALGISQLKKLDSFIQKREEIASYYDEYFRSFNLLYTIPISDQKKSSRHLYPVSLDRVLFCPKEDIFKALQEKGVGVQVHYKPIHKNSFYIEKFGEQRFVVAEDFYKSELSLPCHQGMSLDDAKMVAKSVEEVLSKYSYKGCSF